MAVPTNDVTVDVNIHRDRGWTSAPILDTAILYRHSVVCKDSGGEVVMGDDVASYSSARIIEQRFDNTDDGQSAQMWEGDIELEASAAAVALADGVQVYFGGTIVNGCQQVEAASDSPAQSIRVGRKLSRLASSATRIWVRVTSEAQQANLP